MCLKTCQYAIIGEIIHRLAIRIFKVFPVKSLDCFWRGYIFDWWAFLMLLLVSNSIMLLSTMNSLVYSFS